MRACWSSAQPSELALVGEIGILLQGQGELESIDAALEHLRERTSADVCELFLAESGEREVFLVSHQGADLEAFCRRDRFAIGEGLPGMVLSQPVSVVTQQLPAEREFLRSRVKALGYVAALCTPLAPRSDVSGSILLAWKKPPRDIAGALRMAALSSAPIGTAIDLMRAHVRTSQLRSIVSHSDEIDTHSNVPALQIIKPGTRAPTCPACRTGQVQILGGRMGWPATCKEAGCTVLGRYCIPLTKNSRVWGVATMDLGASAPLPQTRHLPTALWLTEDLSPTDDSEVLSSKPTTIFPTHHSHLQIKCFGNFSITLDGRQIHRTKLGRQKARELLALLIASYGRPRSLESLADQLWPDVPLQNARNRFHVTLSALRNSIESGESPSLSAIHIRRDGNRYSLDPDSGVYVDLWQFHQLVREASVTLRPIERSLSLLEEALSLYSGDIFSAEFTADWYSSYMAELKAEALRAVAALAEGRLRCGQVSTALATLVRAESICGKEARDDQRLQMIRSACLQRQSQLRMDATSNIPA